MEQTQEKLKTKIEIEAESWMDKLNDPYFLPPHDDLEKHFISLFTEYPIEIFKRPTWGKWLRFFSGGSKEKTGVQEILTREYIEALGSFMSKEVKRLNTLLKRKVIILEVAAGNGRLSFFLNQSLKTKVAGQFELIATDLGVWERDLMNGEKVVEDRSQFSVFPIEILDYNRAIEKHNPDIVLCSWMPPFQDWTADFRKHKSVQEYILIGEPDTDADGREWETWGCNYGSDKELQKLRDNQLPPYEAEGFNRIDMSELGKLQLSAISVSEGHNTSSTTLFRRNDI